MIRPVLQDEAFLADVQAAPRGRDQFHLWWLGQSGYLLAYDGAHLLIDPYLSDSLTQKYAQTEKPHVRMTERVVAPGRLDFVDVVTSSHGHTDHLDPQTLGPIVEHARRAPSLLAPRAILDLVHQRWGTQRVIPMNAGAQSAICPFGFTAVPAAHPELSVDDHGNHRYLGYVIQFGQWTIYHSGDTMVYEGMVQALRPFGIDLAILPINGKVGNMNGQDAARLARDIGAGCVIPCHYEMFEFNSADPSPQFIPECQRLGQAYRVLRAGERLTTGSK